MSQVTLYLDDETDALLRDRAQASGMSKSRWVAEVIRRHAQDTWPAEWRALGGAFPDFPLRDAAEATSPAGEDVPRIGF